MLQGSPLLQAQEMLMLHSVNSMKTRAKDNSESTCGGTCGGSGTGVGVGTVVSGGGNGGGAAAAAVAVSGGGVVIDTTMTRRPQKPSREYPDHAPDETNEEEEGGDGGEVGNNCGEEEANTSTATVLVAKEGEDGRGKETTSLTNSHNHNTTNTTIDGSSADPTTTIHLGTRLSRIYEASSKYVTYVPLDPSLTQQGRGQGEGYVHMAVKGVLARLSGQLSELLRSKGCGIHGERSFGGVWSIDRGFGSSIDSVGNGISAVDSHHHDHQVTHDLGMYRDSALVSLLFHRVQSFPSLRFEEQVALR